MCTDTYTDTILVIIKKIRSVILITIIKKMIKLLTVEIKNKRKKIAYYMCTSVL